jgi:hypothetical protein
MRRTEERRRSIAPLVAVPEGFSEQEWQILMPVTSNSEEANGSLDCPDTSLDKP